MMHAGYYRDRAAQARRLAAGLFGMSKRQPQAADQVQHSASAVRQAAGSLRGEEEWMAQLIEQGAAKLSDLADTLRASDAQTLLGKTQEYARRQPVLFAGAAMALG